MAVINSDLDLLNGLFIKSSEQHIKFTGIRAGLLESSYEICLEYELSVAGFQLERQKILPVIYCGIHLDAGYRIDLLIENQIILEIKSVGEIIPIHKAQLMTHLKLSGLKLGLLLNFNVSDMPSGLKRILI